MLHRLPDNPLLTPADVAPTRDDREVYCTLNPGAVRVGSEVLLLVRVGERPVPQEGYVGRLAFDADTGELNTTYIALDDPELVIIDQRKFVYRGWTLLTSLSHLRIARSRDGVHFTFEEAPAIFPSTAYEAYGCEDARITPLEGRYYVTYTAVSQHGVGVAMQVTDDFRTFEHLGLIFPPYQKDVYLFGQKVGGRYVCRHRPYKTEYNPAAIWTAYSPDLVSWGAHTVTLRPRPGTWIAERVGGGAPPIRTEQGWLELYHGCDERGRYGLGAMLSDLEFPERLIACSSQPVLLPEAPYEVRGVYADCVFCNGLLVDADGTMTVYYGAADRVCAAAVTSVQEMIAAARS